MVSQDVMLQQVRTFLNLRLKSLSSQKLPVVLNFWALSSFACLFESDSILVLLSESTHRLLSYEKSIGGQSLESEVQPVQSPKWSPVGKIDLESEVARVRSLESRVQTPSIL